MSFFTGRALHVKHFLHYGEGFPFTERRNFFEERCHGLLPLAIDIALGKISEQSLEVRYQHVEEEFTPTTKDGVLVHTAGLQLRDQLRPDVAVGLVICFFEPGFIRS